MITSAPYFLLTPSLSLSLSIYLSLSLSLSNFLSLSFVLYQFSHSLSLSLFSYSLSMSLSLSLSPSLSLSLTHTYTLHTYNQEDVEYWPVLYICTEVKPSLSICLPLSLSLSLSLPFSLYLSISLSMCCIYAVKSSLSSYQTIIYRSNVRCVAPYTNLYDRTTRCYGFSLKFFNQWPINYPIRDYIVFTQNRRGGWGLPFIYIYLPLLYSNTLGQCMNP